MSEIKLCRCESFETSGVFDLPGGSVSIVEREVHEVYRMTEPRFPRVVVGTAIDRTKNFIAKTRLEFAELNSLMSELTAR